MTTCLVQNFNFCQKGVASFNIKSKYGIKHKLLGWGSNSNGEGGAHNLGFRDKRKRRYIYLMLRRSLHSLQILLSGLLQSVYKEEEVHMS